LRELSVLGESAEDLQVSLIDHQRPIGHGSPSYPESS
jgi:hypothetical protein